MNEVAVPTQAGCSECGSSPAGSVGRDGPWGAGEELLFSGSVGQPDPGPPCLCHCVPRPAWIPSEVALGQRPHYSPSQSNPRPTRIYILDLWLKGLLLKIIIITMMMMM